MDSYNIATPGTLSEEDELLALLMEEEGLDVTAVETIPTRDKNLPPPLSFPQQLVWYLDQLQPGIASYNLPLFLRLSGNLNLIGLEQSINKITERHETLRTTFQ